MTTPSAAHRVLVLNAGSSTLKYQLVDMADGSRPARGTVERIGTGGPADHTEALRAVADELARAGTGLDSPELAAIGHRVVHGGTRYTEPVLVTAEVEAGIEKLAPLAPLHNPVNLQQIRVARGLRPGLPHVAVFDTAFHATLPESAYRYAIDREVADRYGVRRYGFHGTSHAYVSRATARLLGRDPGDVNVIVLHLGNGASVSAVRGGVCVETSMGLTPLEGLVMGTRSGDLDPAVLLHLSREAGMSADELDTLLNTRGGLLGLCGDNDMRQVVRRGAAGDPAARLAFDAYVHRLRKYLGGYLAVLGETHAVAFTAGVGENSAEVREAALRGLGGLGLELDPARNAARSSGARIVSADGSRTAVAVVPTDEEWEIASQTWKLINA